MKHKLLTCLQTGPLPPEVISSGGVLTISNLNETRAGMYTCMAVDHNGMISTANVMVTILDSRYRFYP